MLPIRTSTPSNVWWRYPFVVIWSLEEIDQAVKSSGLHRSLDTLGSRWWSDNGRCHWLDVCSTTKWSPSWGNKAIHAFCFWKRFLEAAICSRQFTAPIVRSNFYLSMISTSSS